MGYNEAKQHNQRQPMMIETNHHGCATAAGRVTLGCPRHPRPGQFWGDEYEPVAAVPLVLL